MPSSLFFPGRRVQLISRDEDGNDMVVLDLMGPGQGGQGICLLSGYSGLMHAPRTPVREGWAYQEGSTPSDFPRVDERIIDLRLSTKGNTPTEWEIIDDLLWQVLGFKRDSYIRYYSQDNTYWRELGVRLDRKPKDQMTLDPSVTQHMIWDITLVACDPWWYAPTLTSTWTNTSGTGTGFLTLENRADQQCWVQFSGDEVIVNETWTLPDAIGVYPDGHSSAGLQVTHTLPLMTPAVIGWMVDTYPLKPLLQTLNASLKWAEMKAETFLFSLPPHTPPTVVPVSVAGGNTASSVTVFMPQRFDRPFGGETVGVDG